MTNPTNTPQDAVERLRLHIESLEERGFGNTEPMSFDDLITILDTIRSLTKPDEEMVAKEIEAELENTPRSQMSFGIRFVPVEKDLASRIARAAIKAITLDLYDGES